MISHWKTIIWQQFGAAIDMLENALNACPDELWQESEFWYISYHTLFFLDYYLSEDPLKFMPPAPFTLSEFDAELKPERVYTKAELLTYLEFSRKKCRSLIAGLTVESAEKLFIDNYRKYSIFEMLLYSMRHVQHHTAQLNQLLRQSGNEAPQWVSRAR
jgi:hypothetical protein